MDADPVAVPPVYTLPCVAFQSSKLKLRILYSYCVVFIFGLPLWWYTTSIERLTLPVERVRSSTHAPELRFPLDVSIRSANGELSSSMLSSLAQHVGILLKHEAQNDRNLWRGLDMNIHSGSQPRTGSSTYNVEIHLDSSTSVTEPSFLLVDRSLHIRAHPNNDLDSLSTAISSALSGLLDPYSAAKRRKPSQKQLAARYANKFRLAFSLLNEDASVGRAVLGWDIESAIQYYLSPVLVQLGNLHNFTIESQVQFHAPLAFDPPQSLSSINKPYYVLGEEELKMFVNSADWTLASSVSEDSVLHFILFVPSAMRRPLTVQTTSGKTSNSFVVPQWGSVVILDPSTLHTDNRLSSKSNHVSTADLSDTFKIFRSQLLTLLGVPSLPPSISPARSGHLSDWQLDALLRKRAMENIKDSKEALSSIVQLVDQIENMPVRQDVKGDVQGALDAIEQVYLGASGSPETTLKHSAEANKLSSRAFFNPGMLALLYFPAEHNYAVYVPLFAPVSVPILVAVLKELVKWRKERKVKLEKTE